MGFFNSIGQVISNRKTFKQWEKNDADRLAQRQALAQSKPATEQELKDAARKGKVMMDIVDIMDTHSEEVAENTETAIMPLAMLLPLTAAGLSGWTLKKTILNPAYTKLNEANKVFMQSDKGVELVEISKQLYEIAAGGTEDIQKMHGQGLKLFNKINLKILSESKNKKVQDLYTRICQLHNAYKNTPDIKNYGKKVGLAGAIFGAIGLGTFIASNIYAAKIQVKSSRIARWQSREDLKDPKYFVQYTDEQIQTAKENIEKKSKENNEGFFSFFKKNQDGKSKFKHNDKASLIATFKDNKNYDKWKADYNLDEKKVKRSLTPEEIMEAQKDQEVIQRVTKIINNKAEEYSENMETAAGVLIGGTPFLGAAIGALVNTIATKSGLGEKFSDKNFEKLMKNIASNSEKEELRKVYNELKTKDDKKLGLMALADKISKTSTYFSKLWEATEGKASNTKGFAKALDQLKRTKQVLFTTKYGRNIVIGYFGTIITSIAGALIGLKLQKASARAGRYIAKRELQQDSNNFIGYSNEQFSSVSNVKAEKKSAFSKFAEYITFIPRVVKDYYNYEKYRKTQAKQDKELLNELVKLDNISDKQLKEAKDLQRKLFTTFESVDDKSQEYSESVEAVNEMSQPFLPFIGLGIASVPLVIGGLKIKKGGTPKVVETITSFLAKHTKFLKGKIASKQYSEISQNISSIVNMQELAPRGEEGGFVKFLNSISSNSKEAQMIKNILESMKSIKGQDNELKAFFSVLSDNPIFKNIQKTEMEEVLNTLSELFSSNSELIEFIPQANQLAKKFMSELNEAAGQSKNLSEAAKKILDKYGDNLPKSVKISNYANIIDIAKGKTNTDAIWKFAGTIKSAVNTPLKATLGGANAAVKEEIKNGNWRNFGKKLKDVMPNGSGYQRLINNIINSSMTDEQALKIYKNLEIILENIPKEELAKIIKTALDEFSKNPEKFMQAVKNGDLNKAFLTKSAIEVPAVAGSTYTALTILLTFITESIFASMQKQAGRLGVMKALEELKDVEYYANEETPNSISPTLASNQPAIPLNNIPNTQTVGAYNDFSKLSPAFSKFASKR